jgi:hypothetical protein
MLISSKLYEQSGYDREKERGRVSNYLYIEHLYKGRYIDIIILIALAIMTRVTTLKKNISLKKYIIIYIFFHRINKK